MMRQANPMAIIVTMLPLFHPSEAFEAIVRGIRMRANPALRRTMPPMSISD